MTIYIIDNDHSKDIDFAYLHSDSWAGRTKTPVIIIGETPKKYRVKFLDDFLKKAKKGDVKLVPKYAIERES